MTRSGRGTNLLYLAIGVVAGAFMTSQSRINGELAVRIGSAPVTALISFGIGTVILGFVVLLSRRTRHGFVLMVQAIKERRLGWYFTLAGVSGATFVFSQSLVVGITGVALFTIAFVCGLTIGSYFLDVRGIGPAGRQPVTPLRTAGALLAIAAVVVAMLGRLGPASGLALLVLPLVFGVFVSWQQIANGLIAVAARTPLVPTAVNFAVGTGVLALFAGFYSLATGLPTVYPTDLWVYLGGPCGVMFVSMTAWVVRRVGALVTSLATTAGQLLMAVIFDIFMPQIEVNLLVTFMGAAIMMLALVLVTMGRARTLSQK